MFATGVSNKQFTRTTGKTPAKVAVQTSTDDFSKLMIYKRLYKKDKAQTLASFILHSPPMPLHSAWERKKQKLTTKIC